MYLKCNFEIEQFRPMLQKQEFQCRVREGLRPHPAAPDERLHPQRVLQRLQEELQLQRVRARTRRVRLSHRYVHHFQMEVASRDQKGIANAETGTQYVL